MISAYAMTSKILSKVVCFVIFWGHTFLAGESVTDV